LPNERNPFDQQKRPVQSFRKTKIVCLSLDNDPRPVSRIGSTNQIVDPNFLVATIKMSTYPATVTVLLKAYHRHISSS
jgi:hypothetical protein